MDSDDLLGLNASNSKTKLINHQHVGVTARLEAPMRVALPECSSGETDESKDIFQISCTKQYSKLSGTEDTESTAPSAPPLSATSTTTESSSKLLYEMHAEKQRRTPRTRPPRSHPNAFSRIEFQLYNKSAKRLKHCKCHRSRVEKKRPTSPEIHEQRPTKASGATRGPNFFQRFLLSFKEMREAKAPMTDPSAPSAVGAEQGTAERAAPTTTEPITTTAIPEDIPHSDEPKVAKFGSGVYPFEHGCSEYLCATDCPPPVSSNVLAERTTEFATRFWAEIFGGLHIGVAFVVTFVLQSYRFVLYSLINTLLVGLLEMTSDYLLKPILTAAFNGFLQPPLIFFFNILSSIRDLLEPVAETINNFMKPIATVGRSLRLVQVNGDKKKFVKDV